MKWFKLDSDFIHDNRIVEIVTQCGHEGLTLYITLLCNFASQWNGEPEKVFIISEKKIIKDWGKSRKVLEKVLENIGKTFNIFHEKNGENYHFQYDKFLKKQSSYFRGVLTKTHSMQENKNKNKNKRKEIYKEKNKEKEKAILDAKRLIDFLNKVSLRSLEHCESNLKPVIARLKEGYTVKDISSVFGYKSQCDEFFINNKHLLCPQTLCRASKFANYLEEARRHAGTENN